MNPVPQFAEKTSSTESAAQKQLPNGTIVIFFINGANLEILSLKSKSPSSGQIETEE